MHTLCVPVHVSVCALWIVCATVKTLIGVLFLASTADPASLMTVTIRWNPPSPLPPSLLFYVVSYRRDFGGGVYSEWVVAAGNLPPVTNHYTVTLVRGDYEYRVIAYYLTDERELARGRLPLTSKFILCFFFFFFCFHIPCFAYPLWSIWVNIAEKTLYFRHISLDQTSIFKEDSYIFYCAVPSLIRGFPLVNAELSVT